MRAAATLAQILQGRVPEVLSWCWGCCRAALGTELDGCWEGWVGGSVVPCVLSSDVKTDQEWR